MVKTTFLGSHLCLLPFTCRTLGQFGSPCCVNPTSSTEQAGGVYTAIFWHFCLLGWTARWKISDPGNKTCKDTGPALCSPLWPRFWVEPVLHLQLSRDAGGWSLLQTHPVPEMWVLGVKWEYPWFHTWLPAMGAASSTFTAEGKRREHGEVLVLAGITSRHFADSWKPDLETGPLKVLSPPLTQFASIGKPCTAHALALLHDANPPWALKGGWGFLHVLHVFWCCFLWMIFFFPQWSGRGCSARRAACCRTSPHQSDTFVSGLYGDTPLLLAMLEQTWLWLREPLRGVIYFSVKYFLHPVILPLAELLSIACSQGCDKHSLMLGLETSGEPPQIVIWHLWKKPQPLVEVRKHVPGAGCCWGWDRSSLTLS